jgi:hypothetical protein
MFAETHEQNTGKSTLTPLLEATDSPVLSTFLATTLGKRNTGIRHQMLVYPHVLCNISVHLETAAVFSGACSSFHCIQFDNSE